MPDLTKGNYKPDKQAQLDEAKKDDSEAEFEREALKKLGGSTAFVRREKLFEE